MTVPMIVEIILTLFTLLFVGVVAYIYIHLISALFVWPPTIPTDKKTKAAMLKAAERYFSLDKNFEVAELGFGYGGLTKIFHKKFINANFTGIEILLVPYLFSKYFYRKNQKIKMIHNSFLNEDLSTYDLFLTFYIRGDKKLPEKLIREAKKGSIIISNNFEILGLELLDKIEVKYLVDSRYVYVHKI